MQHASQFGDFLGLSLGKIVLLAQVIFQIEQLDGVAHVIFKPGFPIWLHVTLCRLQQRPLSCPFYWHFDGEVQSVVEKYASGGDPPCDFRPFR